MWMALLLSTRWTARSASTSASIRSMKLRKLDRPMTPVERADNLARERVETR
jgi:hypothetical protein